MVLSSLITVVVDHKVTVTGHHQPGALIVPVLSQGISKGQALKGLAAAHQAADDVTAVAGGESGNSCDLNHGVFLSGRSLSI